MAAGILNLTIEQGTTWGKTIYLTQRGVGRVFSKYVSVSISVDATAKTFTRDDGGSWVDDGLQIADYIIVSGFVNSTNNGSHIITDLTATSITCAGSTLKDEIVNSVSACNKIVVLKARDLTGATGAAMIRKKYSSTTPAAMMVVTVDPITPENGMVHFALTDTETSAIPCGENTETSASQYVWDFELTIATVKSREVEGIVKISPEATK